MNDKVYEFRNNISRLSSMERGDAYDLKEFDFPKMGEIRRIYENRLLELPETTFFYLYSHKSYIQTLDSFHALDTDCIYSKKMIDTLLSVRDFKHHMYPIAVLEEGAIKFQRNPNGYKAPKPYEDPQSFKKKSLREDLLIFQTLEFLDVFDWEKSDYRQSELSKEVGSPGRVNEYVFKEPSGGFPPLFRLVNDPITLFISAEARDALNKAGIRGPAYLSLRGFRPDSQIQIDVPIPR
jgi:hypothetical protein